MPEKGVAVEFGSKEAKEILDRDTNKLPTSRKERMWVIQTRTTVTKLYAVTARSQAKALEWWDRRPIQAKPVSKEEGEEYVVASWAEEGM